MCNLGEGIRERTELKTKAEIILHLMQSKSYSMDEAFDTIGVSEMDRKGVRELVDDRLAVK